MSANDRLSGAAEADRARAELYDTLGQLREQLNYAKRIDRAMDRAKRRIAETRRTKPVVFAAGVAGGAVVAGAAVWAIASKIAKTVR